MKKPRTPFAQLALIAILKVIGRIIYRLSVYHRDRIPAKGGALLVANHVSYMDFLLMVTAIPRPIYFVMNADVFRKPVLGPILKFLGCVPVEARNGKNDLNAFNQSVVKLIAEGRLVALFAEGTVSRTGQLLEFKKGVEHLSGLIDGPVIPMHFDNVIGTPFTYRAGQGKMIRLRLNTLRRKVRIEIGLPSAGPVTAFSVRQRVKEMEALNFSRRFIDGESLQSRLARVLRKQPRGRWEGHLSDISFRSIPHRISQLNQILNRPLHRHRRVAVLLPKSPEGLLIHLWLLMNHKCVVPINPEWSNEQRLYVMNQSGTGILLTTTDLHFTRCAPVADEVIYMEDMDAAMAERKEVSVVCRNLNSAGRELRSWFSRTPERDDTAALFFHIQNDQWEQTGLTGNHLLAAVHSLRQVHYFDPELRMYLDLAPFTSHGYVIELLIPVICDLSLSLTGEGTSSEVFAHGLLRNEYHVVIATPDQLRAISSLSESRNIPFLRHIFCAGINPGDAAIEVLNSRGITVYCCAGSDQTTSVFAINISNYSGKDIVGKPIEQEGFEPGSIGKPLPGIAVRITDPNDDKRVLERDQAGTVWVSGMAVAGKASEIINGWWKTPWKGWINHRGFLFIAGERQKGIPALD